MATYNFAHELVMAAKKIQKEHGGNLKDIAYRLGVHCGALAIAAKREGVNFSDLLDKSKHNVGLFEQLRAYHINHKCGIKQLARVFDLEPRFISEMGRLYDYSFAKHKSYSRDEVQMIADTMKKYRIGKAETARRFGITVYRLNNLFQLYGIKFP